MPRKRKSKEELERNKTAKVSDDSPVRSIPSQQAQRASPQIPGNVIRKLLIFSMLLLTVPLAVYFGSIKYVFVGSTASSAIAAAISANLVLAMYVYVAWIEDIDANNDKQKSE